MRRSFTQRRHAVRGARGGGGTEQCGGAPGRRAGRGGGRSAALPVPSGSAPLLHRRRLQWSSCGPPVMPGKARQAGGLRRGRCRLQVTQEGDGIDAALRGVTALDVVAARAGQAVWCGAVRPHFLTPREAAEMGPVRVPGMRHPLLLQVPWWPGPQQRSLVCCVVTAPHAVVSTGASCTSLRRSLRALISGRILRIRVLCSFMSPALRAQSGRCAVGHGLRLGLAEEPGATAEAGGGGRCRLRVQLHGTGARPSRRRRRHCTAPAPKKRQQWQF